MSELAVPEGNLPTPVTTQPISTEPGRAMRLVEWAREAQAANHLATALVRTPFAGSWRGDIDGATAAILKGSEVGLTPVTALGAFDNIQGRPAPSALTLRALVQAHGHAIEIVEETAERAVARYKRKDAEEWSTTDFTIADAQAMGLLGRDQWKKQPRNMLVARVTSKAARLVASDVILGIGYSAEELRDSERWDGTTRTPREVEAAPASAAERMAAAIGTPAPAPEPEPEQPADEQDEPLPIEDETPEDVLLNTSSALAKAMFAGIRDAGIDKDGAKAFMSEVVGREITSSKELTEREARQVLDALPAPVDPSSTEAQATDGTARDTAAAQGAGA